MDGSRDGVEGRPTNTALTAFVQVFQAEQCRSAATAARAGQAWGGPDEAATAGSDGVDFVDAATLIVLAGSVLAAAVVLLYTVRGDRPADSQRKVKVN